MTSANLPINLETTPLFKDYVSNVKKQLQEGRNFRAQELQELYKFEPDTREERPILNVPKDRLLADLIVSHKDLIVKDHEHDSLLENRPEEDLTEDERKSPWNEYEQEKYEENYSEASNKKSVNLAASPIFTKNDSLRKIYEMQCDIKKIDEWKEKFKRGEITRHNSLFLAAVYSAVNGNQLTAEDNQHSPKEVTDGEEKTKSVEEEKTCQASENENMIAKSIEIQEEYVSVLTPNLDIYPDNAVAEENDGSQANMLLDVENKNTNLNSVEQQEEKNKSEEDENSMEIEEPDSNILTTNLDNATAAKDDKTCHVKYNSIVYGCPYSPCDYTTKRRTDVIRHCNRRYTRPPACKFRRQLEPKRKGEWARAKKIPVQKNNLNIEV